MAKDGVLAVLDPNLRHELVQPESADANLGSRGTSLSQAVRESGGIRPISEGEDEADDDGSSGPPSDSYLRRKKSKEADKDPPEPGQLTEVAFSRLIALALKCCSVEPDDRPSMYSVAQVLEEVVSGEGEDTEATTALVSMSRSVFPEVAEPILATRALDLGLLSLTGQVSTVTFTDSPALRGGENGSPPASE